MALAALVRQGEPGWRRPWETISYGAASTARPRGRPFPLVGGVASRRDVVRPALERLGVGSLYKVAIRPGTGAFGCGGRTGSARVLDLPETRPAPSPPPPARRRTALQGDEAPLPLLMPLGSGTPVRQPGRLELLRVVLGRGGASRRSAARHQASGAATSMGWASALAFIPLEAEDLPAGTPVDVLRLGDL